MYLLCLRLKPKLNCNPEAIGAHKLILCAASPVLRSLIKEQARLNPGSGMMPLILYLRGISARGLGLVLDLAYKGSISLGETELMDFMAVAVNLKIPVVQRAKKTPAKRESIPKKSEESKKAKVPSVVLPIEKALPEGIASKVPSGIVITPCPGTSGHDEEMAEGNVKTGPDEGRFDVNMNLDDCKEGDREKAAIEPIAGTSDGAKTSLQALIAENARPTDAGGYYCIICDKEVGKGSVKRHFEDLHWSEAPCYYCPACQKAHTSKGAFTKHLSRNHPEWKGVPFQAFLQGAMEPIVNSSDGFPLSLEGLVAENTWLTESGGHFCKFCLKVVGKGSVKRHFEDLHWSGGPSYHCPVPECQKVYTSKNAFRLHIRAKHPEFKGVPLETFRKVG